MRDVKRGASQQAALRLNARLLTTPAVRCAIDSPPLRLATYVGRRLSGSPSELDVLRPTVWCGRLSYADALAVSAGICALAMHNS